MDNISSLQFHNQRFERVSTSFVLKGQVTTPQDGGSRRVQVSLLNFVKYYQVIEERTSDVGGGRFAMETSSDTSAGPYACF